MAHKKKKPNPDADPDRPWNEEEWEAFMKDSDLRSARFGEIFETVMDHPDRDALISRHMGWDEPEDDDDVEREDGFDPRAIEEQALAEYEAEKAERAARGEVDDDPLGFKEEEEDKRRIPAYKLANEVGFKVHEAVMPYVKRRIPEDVENWDRDEIDEKLTEASMGCWIAAAKIIGGHAMGYEDDVLCGNIANVKRGLAGADQCAAALVWLGETNVLPAELVDRLLPDVRAVQEAVRGRIEELRRGVWWQ